MKIDTDEGNLTIRNAIFTQENTVICETFSQTVLLKLNELVLLCIHHLTLLVQPYFLVMVEIMVRVLYCLL